MRLFGGRVRALALGMVLTGACGAWAMGLAGPAAAGDLREGRRIALAQCQACHGLDGLAKHPEAPHIAGESEYYLKRQLLAFRSGERRHELMSIVTRGMSDTEIANVVSYYAAIEIEATQPAVR